MHPLPYTAGSLPNHTGEGLCFTLTPLNAQIPAIGSVLIRYALIVNIVVAHNALRVGHDLRLLIEKIRVLRHTKLAIITSSRHVK